MPKFSLSALILLVFLSCNRSPDSEKAASGVSEEPIVSTLPELVVIRPEARVIVDDWPQFRSLEERMNVVREADDREELALLVEELGQICKQVEENAFPGELEKPSVRSRLKVLRTYLGKLDAALFYRTDTGEPLTELMVAYNALRQQFNVIVSTTLTPEMFMNDTIPDTD